MTEEFKVALYYHLTPGGNVGQAMFLTSISEQSYSKKSRGKRKGDTNYQKLEELLSIFGIKEVVWTGWSIPNFFAANRNSQQQSQQLHIKLTLFLIFSPHLGCLVNYNLMDFYLLCGNERETGVSCYIFIVLIVVVSMEKFH